MTKNLERSSSSDIMDMWKKKKVKVMNGSGQIENDWEVAATENALEPKITVIKLNGYGQIAERKTVPYEEFLNWQN